MLRVLQGRCICFPDKRQFHCGWGCLEIGDPLPKWQVALGCRSTKHRIGYPQKEIYPYGSTWGIQVRPRAIAVRDLSNFGADRGGRHHFGAARCRSPRGSCFDEQGRLQPASYGPLGNGHGGQTRVPSPHNTPTSSICSINLKFLCCFWLIW